MPVLNDEVPDEGDFDAGRRRGEFDDITPEDFIRGSGHGNPPGWLGPADISRARRQLPTGTTDVGRTEPAGRIAVTGPADEILGRDVIEFAAPAAGIEIALVRYFVIQNWHGLIIAQLA